MHFHECPRPPMDSPSILETDKSYFFYRGRILFYFKHDSDLKFMPRREFGMENSVKPNIKSSVNILKFIILNLIGIFMFFVTIKIGDTSSIPVDFVVTTIRKIPYFDLAYGVFIVVVGAIFPFIRKTWNKDKVTMVFSFLKLLAIPFLVVWLTKTGPARWFTAT